MLYLLDLAGTFVFALSGGFLGVRRKLDLLGVLVLSVATGVGGGMIRDVLLGATPPAVFQDEWYFVVCLVGGLLVFFGSGKIAKRWNRVMLADAVGLGVFAGIGAAKAMQFGLGPIGTIMMAAFTATGGGVVRDLLVQRVPVVIQKDFYATAALLGGAAYFLAIRAGASSELAMLIAFVVATGLRLIAMRLNLALPKPATRDVS